MKKAILYLILIIGLTRCEPFDLDVDLDLKPEPQWCSYYTKTSLKTVDYYTKKPLPDIKVEIYREPFISFFGPYSFAEYSTNSEGLADFVFNQDSFTRYHLKVLPSEDTTHIYTSGLGIKPGCDNNFLIRMKPVQVLNLTVKNKGTQAFGKTTISITTKETQPIDLIDGYTFGSHRVDSFPIGFEKTFKFKVVPDQDLRIHFTSGTTSRSVTFKSNSTFSGGFIWSL
jgi:hypothetical protein